MSIQGEDSGPGRRRARPDVDVPHSVLGALSERSGDAPRVSLREEPSGHAGPPIDPTSDECSALPEGRGTYRILGEIARGGMGVVLRSHDTDLGRDVAMKVLAKELAGRTEVVQRFVEEAQIGGQLQHPGIVPVYELGLTADERPYFTMKLVKGRTLAALLAERESTQADRRRLLDVFEAVCQTVAYAHSRGVIHRDLKPANIMVGAFGEVQVVDWGLAKVLARGGKADEARAREARQPELTVLETVRSVEGSGSGSHSIIGSVLGTPAYMPPEQARGNVDRLDERADVFALGAILCELLTGAPPYTGEAEKTILQAAQAQLDDALARLEGCDADPELVELASQCLVAAPAARPRHAGVVAESLRAYLEGIEERARAAQIEAAEARVLAAEERKARKLTLALAAAVLGIVALGAGGWYRKQSEERAELARIEGDLRTVERESQELQADGRAEEASNAARGGLLLVAGLAPEAPLRARAETFAEEARKLAERADSHRRRAERDATLFRHLDELRLAASEAGNKAEYAALDVEFGDAFQAWGLDVDADLVASLEALRASGQPVELSRALDDWAAVRRWAHGWSSRVAEDLNGLSSDLDPDPVRARLREGLMKRDRAALLAVAEEQGASLSASTAWVLGNALNDLGARNETIRLLERAVGRHPDDLRLRLAVGRALLKANRPEDAVRHASAAAALRPGMPAVAMLEAEVLSQVSRFPAAAHAWERALALNPGEFKAIIGRGYALLELGDFRGAVDCLEPYENELEFDKRLILETSRFYAEDIDLAELEQRLKAIGNPYAMTVMAWMVALDEESDPEQIARADEIINNLPPVPERGVQRMLSILRASVAVAADRPEDCLAACLEAVGGTDYVPPGDQVAVACLRARALAQIGFYEEAAAWLQEAKHLMVDLLGDEPEAWSKSRLYFLLKLAEKAVEQ